MAKSKNEVLRRRKRRITFVGVICCLCITALLALIGYLKVTKGSEYERNAVMQLVLSKSNIERETNPNRGYILDRNRQPIAVSSRVYNIILDVSILDSRIPTTTVDHKKKTLEALSETLEIPLSELEVLFAKDAEGKLKKPTNYYIVARKVPSATAMKLKELNLKDVYFEDDTQRKYTDPYFAPQTIGFLRGDSSWGLENQYNAELVGEPGRVFRTYDPDGNLDTQEQPAQDGYTLVLTMENGIQRIAQDIVNEAAAQIECEYTAMLVMDPYTGEIFAAAQWPSFSLADPANPLLFTDQRISNYWEALSAEEQLNNLYSVWGNYHINHSFEPGSIFKPVVVAAAIEENIIDPATFSTFCNAKVQVADWVIPCWREYGHGGQNVVEVLANSCNMGMIDIIQRLGRDLFFKYRNDFGYGELTDIDLPGEASVSSEAVMIPWSKLNPVELAASSMGQGFNNTAIQAIVAFSAVINGGNVMKPYMVSQIMDEHGNVVRENTPTVVRKAVSTSTSDFVREALQSVVSENGTGKAAMIEGYTIGGKTGSGQQGDKGTGDEKMTLSFMAFTPVENPEYIVLVIVDNPTNRELTSGASVAPMMKKALEQIIQYKNIPPSDEEAELRALFENTTDRSALGDYSGMQLVDATHNLNNLDIDYQVVGSGTVISHHYPAAGQAAPNGSPVFLYMDTETQYEGDMTFVPDVEGLPMEQAERYISDANLTPITFIDKQNTTGDQSDAGSPTTYYPTQVGTSEGYDGTTEVVQFTVYKQYPMPGTYIQKGTEIKLKVR